MNAAPAQPWWRGRHAQPSGSARRGAGRLDARRDGRHALRLRADRDPQEFGLTSATAGALASVDAARVRGRRHGLRRARRPLRPRAHAHGVDPRLLGLHRPRRRRRRRSRSSCSGALLVGIGLGGEWSAGSVLVAETWPAAHRGKAIGLMQSGWAVGYILAAALARARAPTRRLALALRDRRRPRRSSPPGSAGACPSRRSGSAQQRGAGARSRAPGARSSGRRSSGRRSPRRSLAIDAALRLLGPLHLDPDLPRLAGRARAAPVSAS